MSSPVQCVVCDVAIDPYGRDGTTCARCIERERVERYAASIAKQAATATDEGLVLLLIYATRPTIAGSKAAAISEAETKAVLAEYRKRGLRLPFWYHEQEAKKIDFTERRSDRARRREKEAGRNA